MSRENPATTHDNAGIAAWNFTLKASLNSYEDCERFFLASTNGRLHWETEALGPKMRLRRQPDYYAVVLYDTEIIRYYADGTFSVDNGGFATPTTRERLAAVVPNGFMVYHHKKQLGLVYIPDRRMADHAQAAGRDGAKLWPLDHSKRISPTTIQVVK